MSILKIAAEFIGTTFLLMAIVGAGFMAENLTDVVAIQLIMNAMSAALMLFVIISLFAEISGAHFNPLVTLYQLYRGEISASIAASYVIAQALGALLGTVLANLMFAAPAVEISQTNRSSLGLFLAEIVATFGLLLVIGLKPNQSRFLVPAWIASAYFFTSSTSFANPAVTFGRVFTDSFAGIAPGSVLGFLGAQVIALMFVALILPRLNSQITK